MFRGTCSLIRSCLSKDRIPIALSLFSTSSLIVIPEDTHLYDIYILNNTDENFAAKILIDIYFKDNQVHPEGHYAYYSKNIFLQAREFKHLVMRYNWKDSFTIHFNGCEYLPDTGWRGLCSNAGAYLIQAILLDDRDHRLDSLSIVQKLVQ